MSEMPSTPISRKKLIEVALPLKAINDACIAEASPFTPRHPRSLHVWWARRRLAAARSVIFSQMVDDPSTYADVLLRDPKLRSKAESVLKARTKVWAEAKATADKATEAGITAPAPGPQPVLEEIIAELERNRLFKIIEDLVLWENTTNEEVLEKARAEIWQSWRRACADNAHHPRAKELFDRNKLPAFHDPFAGGGALPLEAQRLGLEAWASDLNPVAVLINKAMIEIPPKFADQPPVNPESRAKVGGTTAWKGAQGLAEDVRYYGQWMRDEAEKRIGHLYPKVEVTEEMAKERPDLKGYVGKKLTVIAWLWARTVKSPNPAFAHVDVPLASTFMLSTKAGKEAYVDPVIEGDSYRFTVKVGKPKNAEAVKVGTTAGKRAAFRCLMSGVPVTYDHIRNEGKSGRMGVRLMAIVTEGDRGRVYLSPMAEHEALANSVTAEWKPEMVLPDNPRDFKTPNYGLTTYGDLFTPRQLVALTTFSDLVAEAREKAFTDAVTTGMPDDKTPLRDGGSGALAYAEAVGMYAGIATSRWSDMSNALCSWNTTNQNTRALFARQAIPMVWDFVELSPFSKSGSWYSAIESIVNLFPSLTTEVGGKSLQENAAVQRVSTRKVISTDPPYYDNIGYADLSDFFYVWLRRSLKSIFPELLSTLAVPKADELVATPYRHGTREKAEIFFLDGMTKAMRQIEEQSHPDFPVTIYYAFKQSEVTLDSGTASTGWETFLDAVIRSGFSVTGTWPIRTERTSGIKERVNALASSIVLVCRKRSASSPTITSREFRDVLKAELPAALAHLQRSNIAPVDLAQAAIGPGMGVYTRYAQVLDAEGKPFTVRKALALINEILDETLAEQEGDFNADTRWALAWFEQYGYDAGDYGVADVLARAKVTSVTGLVDAGILKSKSGKVQLLRPSELPADWDPATDKRLTEWEMVHHLIRIQKSEGESAAASLMAKLGAKAEVARELAYRLYTLCERSRRAAEALAYNDLVQSWPGISDLARKNATLSVSLPDPTLL